MPTEPEKFQLPDTHRVKGGLIAGLRRALASLISPDVRKPSVAHSETAKKDDKRPIVKTSVVQNRGEPIFFSDLQGKSIPQQMIVLAKLATIDPVKSALFQAADAAQRASPENIKRLSELHDEITTALVPESEKREIYQHLIAQAALSHAETLGYSFEQREELGQQIGLHLKESPLPTHVQPTGLTTESQITDKQVQKILDQVEELRNRGELNEEAIIEALDRLNRLPAEELYDKNGSLLIPNTEKGRMAWERAKEKRTDVLRAQRNLAEIDPRVQAVRREFLQQQRVGWQPIDPNNPTFAEFKTYLDGWYAVNRSGTIEYFLQDPNVAGYLRQPGNYRGIDYLFNKIISKVIIQRNTPSRDLYTLYEQADMTSFLNFVGRIEGAHRTPGLKPRRLGDVLVEDYEIQQDAIFQSHDVDFWAGHGAGEMRQFMSTIALYKNEYGEIAASNPVINAAMHAYEMALLIIRDSNNGYITPASIGYDPKNRTYFWDQMAEEIFETFVRQGVVLKIRRNPDTGLPVAENNVIQVEEQPLNWERDLDELEIKKTMKLAKGFGIVNLRLLEIFANSRGPGSDHPEFGMGGFHSIPYEGIARYIQPLSHLFTKWKFGGELYYPFFQQILDPKGRNWSEKEFEIIEAARAHELDEVLSPEAQRIFDLDNLDNFSGGFGPWSKWRILDAILGFDDRQKEWLGGAIRLSLSQGWAEDQVKRMLERQGRTDIVKNFMKPGWLHRQLDFHFHRGDYQKHIANDSGTAMVQKLARAHNAYVWLQMVERNPLLIARNFLLRRVEIEGKPKIRWTLRHQIIQDILGIDFSQGDFLAFKTPSDQTKVDLMRVAHLEADLAAIRERLLNDPEGPRAVRASDFEQVIQGENAEERRRNARKYWAMVYKQIIDGTLDPQRGIINPESWAEAWNDNEFIRHTRSLTEEVGVYTPTGERRLRIEWDRVERIDELLKTREHLALGWLARKEWNWLAATDDVSWRFLDLINLGARQWIRRAGDLASHQAGTDMLTAYLMQILGPEGNERAMDKYIEHLQKTRDAYAGDDIAVSWKTGYILTKATNGLFEAPWWGDFGPTRFLMLVKNASKMEEIYGRGIGDNWTANERRRWWTKIMKARIVPPNEISVPYMGRLSYHGRRLVREMRATRYYVIWEIITLGVLMAAILTAITAMLQGLKGEEERQK